MSEWGGESFLFAALQWPQAALANPSLKAQLQKPARLGIAALPVLTGLC
jgi:hypothetical protein